ncbi:MAG: hypothetical protein WDM96_08520 [Lacunisphaera sp.]
MVDGNFLLNQLTLSAGLRQSLTLTDGGVTTRQLTFGGMNPVIALTSDMSATVNANVAFHVRGHHFPRAGQHPDVHRGPHSQPRVGLISR